MILWREKKGCYRVTLLNTDQEGFMLLVGAVSLAFGGQFLVLALPAHGFHLLVLLPCLLFLALGLGAIWSTFGGVRRSAWAEIDVHGGLARWRGRACDAAMEFLEVSSFHRVVFKGERCRIEAHLRDGRTLPVFSPWPWYIADADKLVAQMNEYIGAESDTPPATEGSER